MKTMKLVAGVTAILIGMTGCATTKVGITPMDTYLLNNCKYQPQGNSKDPSDPIVIAQGCFGRKGLFIGNVKTNQLGSVIDLGKLNDQGAYGGKARVNLPLEILLSSSTIEKMKAAGIVPVDDWRTIQGVTPRLRQMIQQDVNKQLEM